MLRNLANNSPWLTKPELVEITASTVTLSPRDQRRVSNFSMRVGLKRASDPKAASSAASNSAAASAVSAVIAKPASATPASAKT